MLLDVVVGASDSKVAVELSEAVGVGRAVDSVSEQGSAGGEAEVLAKTRLVQARQYMQRISVGVRMVKYIVRRARRVVGCWRGVRAIEECHG